MKQLFTFITLLVLSLTAHAQYSANATRSINPPGLRMMKVGKGLTIGGSALLVGGIILVSQADSYYYQSSSSYGQTYDDGSLQGALGVMMIAGGIGMIVPGIILWSKGSRKFNHYLEEEQKKLSLNLQGAGVRLQLKL